jgi:hypothetical protein
MSQGIKDIYTKDKKKTSTKTRILANSTNSSNGTYTPSKEELAKEEKLKARDPLTEVEVFKAVTFAGMCQPCLKNCKKCATGFFLKDDGSCVKGCDALSETLTVDNTTGQSKCKKDNKPRLQIVWGSQKKEGDLMDDD